MKRKAEIDKEKQNTANEPRTEKFRTLNCKEKVLQSSSRGHQEDLRVQLHVSKIITFEVRNY